MKSVTVPDSAIVRGEIHSPRDINLLTQDMLEVELPGEIFIDVGWFPEHDPQGEYVIRVFHKDSDHLLLVPYRTRNVVDVTLAVQSLSTIYAGSHFPDACISNSRSAYNLLEKESIMTYA